MEKTTKYLRCFKDGRDVTKGKRYLVLSEDYDGYEIVDDAGERHWFTKKPDYNGKSFATWLTLETDDSAVITLLPDESLGGVLREYREVKRKASVGELVKITEVVSGYFYAVGGVGRVTRSDSRMIHADGDVDGCAVGHTPTDGNRYVVLEPTNILRIDNVRYTMVDRKAAVGERVIVTENKESGRRFKVGEVYVVICVDNYMDKDVIVKHPEGMHSPSGGARLFDYAVLEPVEPAPSTPVLLSAQPAESQAAANIASLALRLTQAEAKIAALESVIGALTERKVASGPVDNALPTFAKSPQMIRDEIVERAKADVLRLMKTRVGSVPVHGDITYTAAFDPDGLDTVGFEVNRAKQTVVALLRTTFGSDSVVWARGIAKCAPGETFNAHIGRAISLRRALGLAVPAEYLDAPGPTEVRVGDVVTFNDHDAGKVLYRVNNLREVGDNCTIIYDAPGFGFSDMTGGGASGGDFSWAKVVDDSREDGGQSAASSALKGAA